MSLEEERSNVKKRGIRGGCSQDGGGSMRQEESWERVDSGSQVKTAEWGRPLCSGS